MSNLQDYLKRHGAKPVNPAFMEEYDRQMREVVIPKIIADRQENARRVAEIRHKVLF